MISRIYENSYFTKPFKFKEKLIGTARVQTFYNNGFLNKIIILVRITLKNSPKLV